MGKRTMKLRAKVKTVHGESTNYLATIIEGKPVPVEQLPNPTWLEISEECGAFFLLYINADGHCFADTWHQTLESAQREARLGFGINAEDWIAM
jgi:hypothetical protein